MDSLRSNNIDAEAVERGLDHGVWASFKVAFDPQENPLNVPLVQVSLFSSEDPDQHYNLGRAVANLRSQNIAIIVSGMAVHNLRDFRFATGVSRPMPCMSSVVIFFYLDLDLSLETCLGRLCSPDVSRSSFIFLRREILTLKSSRHE